MAIEKIMGSETELGITTRVASGFDPVGGAIYLINALPGEVSSRALWDYTGENPLLDARGYEVTGERERPTVQDNRALNKVLPNGGRLYVDGAHPEYSTPECATLKDIVSSIQPNALVIDVTVPLEPAVGGKMQVSGLGWRQSLHVICY